MAEVVEVKKEKKKRRFGRNLLIWFMGFLFGIIALIGGVFCVLKFVPTKNLIGMFGADSNDVVSEDVGELSLFDAVFKLNTITIGDIKPVKNMIADLKNEPTIGKFIEIDEVALEQTSLTGIANIFGNAIKMKEISTIKLADVISVSSNQDVFDIITSVVDKSATEVTIGDLSGFEIANIKLETVLPEAENQDTYKILRSGLSKPAGYEIIIGDLEDFKIEDVRLSAVLDPSESNPFLSALLEKDSSASVPSDYVTFANIGEKISELTLNEVYSDINCFTTNSGQAVSGAGRYDYNETKGEYTYNASGAYYVNQKGAWILLLYTFENVDASGYAVKYTPATTTIGDLGEGLERVSSSMKNATIRQLVDCGLIENGTYEDYVYAMKVGDVLEALPAMP